MIKESYNYLVPGIMSCVFLAKPQQKGISAWFIMSDHGKVCGGLSRPTPAPKRWLLP